MNEETCPNRRLLSTEIRPQHGRRHSGESRSASSVVACQPLGTSVCACEVTPAESEEDKVASKRARFEDRVSKPPNSSALPASEGRLPPGTPTTIENSRLLCVCVSGGARRRRQPALRRNYERLYDGS
ncbi:hypothetical protein MRX96_014794 [Rhipicephalus microplus]